MAVISRLQVLSKLKRFCTRSLASVDAIEQVNVDGIVANDGRGDYRADYTNEDKIERLDEVYSLIKDIAGQEGLPYLELLERQFQDGRPDLGIERKMIGGGIAMQEVYDFIAKVAPTDSTVLICGESGTGKELAARAIHHNSRRASKPFVAINCAAITETLLESELFGHEKGAFTGAVAQKKGKLEVAEGGTLFLDEIGELEPTFQAKLLRVLQEREYERVGGTRTIKTNIRLIAATNKNLEERIKDGEFRLDLFFRLNVVSTFLPSLRERMEDVPSLASHFTEKYSRKVGRPVLGVSAEACECLLSHDWPGNVRELENVIERAVVMGASDYVMPEDLPHAICRRGAERRAEAGEGPTSMNYREAVLESKKRLILKAFDLARGNYIEAARLLSVHPTYLQRLIRNMNLRQDLKK
ncbi:MAG: sigma-54-dependent Fis family transcriptional regulator [Chloracidobacterium sp.]|nr:sigma-54-dependent Fis family transcriptional regulator [Chloracidobacterium sp.]